MTQPSSPFSRTTYTNTKLPSLKGYSAIILAGAFHGAIVNMFKAANFTIVQDIEKADLVVFTGGSDVHPSLYGEVPIPQCYTNPPRDKIEKEIFEKCVEMKTPMFGICRGLQFLHVMNGGKLYQDITNHAGGNHAIVDLDSNEFVQNVSSIHHQMCIYNPDIGMDLLAVASYARSTHYQNGNSSLRPAGHKIQTFKRGSITHSIPGSVLEVEAAVYPKTLCFGVQGHPEICDGGTYQAWSMDLVSDFLLGEVNGVSAIKAKIAA